MDHTRLIAATAQHNQTTDPYSSNYTTHYSPFLNGLPTQNSYPYSIPNPNPLKSHELYDNIGLLPPGVPSFTSLNSYPHAHQAQPSLGTYYQDPNAQNLVLRELGQQFGSNPLEFGAGVTLPPNGTQQLFTVIPNSTLWSNPAVVPRGRDRWKKVQKKTKIVQSAYCEVCKIDCNSKDVLEQHKLGKKHKKNVEKLLVAVAPASSALAMSSNPVIGPQENTTMGKAVSVQKKKNKAADSPENLETKRRKVLECGAAADAVRTCTTCNVVCNSETVFNYHLSGQKHAAMVKKLTGATPMLAPS